MLSALLAYIFSLYLQLTFNWVVEKLSTPNSTHKILDSLRVLLYM